MDEFDPYFATESENTQCSTKVRKNLCHRERKFPIWHKSRKINRNNKIMNKREIGNSYEELACRHLEEEGMQIIRRNYRVRIGEIDIIAKDVDELVFIEVKYRKSQDQGGAFYAISESKKKRIRRVAEWFMNQNHISPNAFCRFDAVLIDNGEITHVKNAW